MRENITMKLKHGSLFLILYLAAVSLVPVETFGQSGPLRIDGFSPAAGPVGTSVTISGAGFLDATSVRFNGIASTNFVVDSDAQIRSQVPAGATSGPVSITTAGGAATSGSIFSLPPTITGHIGGGPRGALVTIYGTNFTGATDVGFTDFGPLGFFYRSASFIIQSPTQIRAALPNFSGLVFTGNVRVTNPAGVAIRGGIVFRPFDFSCAVPVITAVSPAIGSVGTSVTISGACFGRNVLDVRFCGVSATSFTIDSDAQITAIVPAGATSGAIVVESATGIRSSLDAPSGPITFTVIGAPPLSPCPLFVPPPPIYEGWHDLVDCTGIYGWAWDRNQPNTPINVDIYDGTTLLATIPANLYRQDLVDAGIGNGYHGFSFPIPASLRDGLPHSIRVRYAGTSIDLGGQFPTVITCSASPISFRRATNYGVGAGPQSVALGDFNWDGMVSSNHE